jgi:sporulation protein YlmC with PRC-barrel domain
MNSTRFIFGVVIVLIGLVIVIALLNFATVPVTTDERRAEPYTAAGDTLSASRDIVRARTAILEMPVYTMTGDPLGLLYDAYVSPEDGTILWYSINIDGRPNGALVSIPANEMIMGPEEASLKLNIPHDTFLERPQQDYYDDEFENLINLRDLPGTPITDSYETVLGEVERLTFEGNKLQYVIFSVPADIMAENEVELYTLPFEYVFFERNAAGETYRGDYEIVLTERQAGAIQAQMRALNETDVNVDVDIYDLR